MGRGRSKVRRRAVKYDDFMQMSDSQKYQTMQSIIDNQDIVVPDYLDQSAPSKVMYALGMSGKPTVVSDSALDSMPGEVLYRTVYNNSAISAENILDQVRNGDYTQLSSTGGSAHGRAIYFAREDFTLAARYGGGKDNPLVTRAKWNTDANIVDEYDLAKRASNDTAFTSTIKNVHRRDVKTLYAIAHGIDGWYNKSAACDMIINRSKITMSDTNKSPVLSDGMTPAGSWREASNGKRRK